MSFNLELNYEPNFHDYNRGAALDMNLTSKNSVGSGSLRIYGHAVGSKFRGLIGIVALYVLEEFGRVQTVPEDIFQVNYVEAPEDAERRFRPWLEAAITRTLVLWRKNL